MSSFKMPQKHTRSTHDVTWHLEFVANCMASFSCWFVDPSCSSTWPGCVTWDQCSGKTSIRTLNHIFLFQHLIFLDPRGFCSPACGCRKKRKNAHTVALHVRDCCRSFCFGPTIISNIASMYMSTSKTKLTRQMLVHQ